MKKEKLEKRKQIIMDMVTSSNYVPMRLRDLAVLLNVPKPKRKALYEVVDQLAAQGELQIGSDGRVRKGTKELLEGVFIAHPKGFGFVETDGEGEDVFIPEDAAGGALHQDRVRVLLREGEGGKGRRREGRVVRILSGGLTQVVGTYQKGRRHGYVIPDDSRITGDIWIPRGEEGDASQGEKVVAALTGYSQRDRARKGRITEVLGYPEEPGVDVLSVAKGYGLPMEFPERALRQARRTADHVLSGDFAGRLDLRDWDIVTIDGEDAKDLDDGVSLYKEGENYHLGVHIADVSNYVQAGSAMDREALRRGTSVYLVDRVIPMLPVELSNGICSLNAGEDRLALSCLMEINKRGKVVSHRLAETVIHVKERMTYTQVQEILSGSSERTLRRYRELAPMLLEMGRLSGILRKKRRQRGAIDFDFPECKILLSPKGRPIDIKRYERNEATDLIEDFMLLANETVAQEYFGRRLPFLYRAHENPDPEKIEALLSLMRAQGFSPEKKKEEITPLEVQKLLEAVKGTPGEPMLTRLALRSMKQAQYTQKESGHFGLAAKYYCHFTSPIRRYPDLQIHRIIKDQLRGRMDEERIRQYREILDEVARQSCATERRAEEAERETDKMKKAEYMSFQIGKEFDGIISGVTGWGLYVELPNTVEGLVHVTTLRDDFYVFHEETCEMTGEATKKSYRLGQPVRVRVADADPGERTVDFVLV